MLKLVDGVPLAIPDLHGRIVKYAIHRWRIIPRRHLRPRYIHEVHVFTAPDWIEDYGGLTKRVGTGE